MLKEKIHIAVPTAFFNDESLNVQGTLDHIKDLYKQGVKSVLVSGSTGEQHSLNLKEKIALVNGILSEDELVNNMEIIFGVSSIKQKEAEELAKRIANTKIAGILLGYPPYILPTQEEAVVYSQAIINQSNKPTILYNNPKRTGFDLSVESIVRLSEIELVIGLKEAGDEEKVERVKKDVKRNNFYFYAGGEVNIEDKVLQGFDRLSSIAGNISPVVISQWFDKLLTKQKMTEQEKEKIDLIIEQVYQGTPLVNLKQLINQKGIPMGICSSPIGNTLN